MSHVNIIVSPCRMSISPVSHVEFKKLPSRSVEFKGQEPYKRPYFASKFRVAVWRLVRFPAPGPGRPSVGRSRAAADGHRPTRCTHISKRRRQSTFFSSTIILTRLKSNQFLVACFVQEIGLPGRLVGPGTAGVRARHRPHQSRPADMWAAGGRGP